MSGCRLAVMQPYFLPYLGYFRLLAEADLFVIYDCVQHIRRGWVHRNRLKDEQGQLQWLTLPLEHAQQEAPITSLRFPAGAGEEMANRTRRFPACSHPRTAHARRLVEAVGRIQGTPADYISRLLEVVAGELGITTPLVRSSTIGLGPEIKGQDRILALCKHFRADRYLNAPGGHELYDQEDFASHRIRLEFLPDWTGAFESVLQRFNDAEIDELRREITRP